MTPRCIVPSLSRDGTALHDLDSEEEIYNELVPFIHTLYFKVIPYYTSRPLCLGFNLIRIQILDSEKMDLLKIYRFFSERKNEIFFFFSVLIFMSKLD